MKNYVFWIGVTVNELQGKTQNSMGAMINICVLECQEYKCSLLLPSGWEKGGFLSFIMLFFIVMD